MKQFHRQTYLSKIAVDNIAAVFPVSQIYMQKDLQMGIVLVDTLFLDWKISSQYDGWMAADHLHHNMLWWVTNYCLLSLQQCRAMVGKKRQAHWYIIHQWFYVIGIVDSYSLPLTLWLQGAAAQGFTHLIFQQPSWPWCLFLRWRVTNEMWLVINNF